MHMIVLDEEQRTMISGQSKEFQGLNHYLSWGVSAKYSRAE